jgi:hypothetical protein
VREAPVRGDSRSTLLLALRILLAAAGIVFVVVALLSNDAYGLLEGWHGYALMAVGAALLLLAAFMIDRVFAAVAAAVALAGIAVALLGYQEWLSRANEMSGVRIAGPILGALSAGVVAFALAAIIFLARPVGSRSSHVRESADRFQSASLPQRQPAGASVAVERATEPGNVSLIALLLAGAALLLSAFALLRGAPLCSLDLGRLEQLDLPSGWSQTVSPTPIGWSATFASEDDDRAYLTAYCTNDPTAVLRAIREHSDGTQIGFASVGDDVVAVRNDEVGESYEVTWRKGSSVAQLSTTFGGVSIDELEELAGATDAVLP